MCGERRQTTADHEEAAVHRIRRGTTQPDAPGRLDLAVCVVARLVTCRVELSGQMMPQKLACMKARGTR